jgi:hypothetical protein
LIFEVDTLTLNKNLNLLCLNYNKVINNFLLVLRRSINFFDDTNYIYYWYYTYYISALFGKNLTDSNNKKLFEKYNIISVNFKSKQLRLNILTYKSKVLNITVGRVLATLKIIDKSKKKTNKGERLLVEYLSNFLTNTSKFFGKARIAVLKVINGRYKNKLNANLLKILNQKFRISKLIYDFKVANNFFKLKKVRSIKKRIKKRIIKQENIINL